MIQSVQSNTAVRPTAVLTAPQVAITQRLSTQPLQIDTQDTLKVQGNKITDKEALEMLKYIQTNFGSLRRPRFFDSKKISPESALKRLKEGDKVFVKNRHVKDIRDTFKSIDDLVLFDDLQGRRKDHGVAKAEHRLPLLFLDGQKLEPYRDDNGNRLDAYNAYAYLKKDWRIRVNGKAIKPKDLAAYVVNKGLTASKDPGLKTLAQFKKLSATGWQVNGRDVNRETAYMAYITDSSQIKFQGANIQSAKDFALLMNLVGNEDNGAIDKVTRGRLLNFKLNGFSTPGIQNHLNVYQLLERGQALSYQGNLIHSLKEMEIFDALEGTRQPTQALDAKLYDALIYLGNDKGLSVSNTFKAWQSLGENKTISYTFAGGPTGEGFTLSAHSHHDLIELKSDVVAQRHRDQFRPGLSDAKGILSDRLPQFESPLADNLSRTRTAADRARQDLPIQEQKRDKAERDYNEIKPISDRSYADYKDAERVADRAEREYSSDKRDYDWVKRDFDRIQRDYDRAQRDYQGLISAARRYEQQASAADRKAASDPDNAASHRQKAASLRTKAKSARNQADRRYNDMQRFRGNMDRKRWDVDRARRTMDRSRQNFWDARQTKDYKKNEWQHQNSRLNEAKGRLDNAETKIRYAQQTIADAGIIEDLSSKATDALDTLKRLNSSLGSYGDYAKSRSAIHQAARDLRDVLNNGTYTETHGKTLARKMGPLMTLLNNMDKPAPSKA